MGTSFFNSFVRFFGLNGEKDSHSPVFSAEEHQNDEENASRSSDKANKNDDEAHVEVNLLRHDLNAKRGFHKNSIRTSKYTILSAFPLSLFSQFHKVSNIYFLFVMTISLIPGASPINPLSSVVPFSIVLGAGIIKDLWMDAKRQRSDKKANNAPVRVLRDGDFVTIPSSDVYPGDVMLYRVGEEIKADCIALNSAMSEGLLYIDTASLDGETNAKTRRAKAETVDALATVEDITELAFQCIPVGELTLPLGKETNRNVGRRRSVISKDERMSNSHSVAPDSTHDANFSVPSGQSSHQTPSDVDAWETDVNTVGGIAVMGSAPNADLTNWFGKLRLPSGKVVPLGIEQFIPRGCVLRNTEWVLAAVMYTGKDTKILLNYNVRREKYSIITKHLNYLNICLFITNQVLMLTVSGLSIWFKHKAMKVYGTHSAFAAWYMQFQVNRYGDLTLYWWRYLTNFVLLSYLIPLSLYVTLEFNKAMQLMMMASDRRMAVHDNFSEKPRYSKPKTAELNAQLAHVRYIFTDKTGTLTENLMTYVGGFLGGVAHDECMNPGGVGLQLREDLLQRRMALHRIPVATSLTHPVREGAASYMECSPAKKEKSKDGALQDSSGGAGAGSGKHLQSLMASVAEEELELNPRFRYLRALSVCHSVLCFKVSDVAESSQGGDAKTIDENEEEKAAKKSSCCCCCCCCSGSSEDDLNDDDHNANLPDAVSPRGDMCNEEYAGHSSGLHSVVGVSLQPSQNFHAMHASSDRFAFACSDNREGGQSERLGDNYRGTPHKMHRLSESYNHARARSSTAFVNLPFSSPKSSRSPSFGEANPLLRIDALSPCGVGSGTFPMVSFNNNVMHSRANSACGMSGDILPGHSSRRPQHLPPSASRVGHMASRRSMSGGFGSFQHHPHGSVSHHNRVASASKLHGRTNSASWYYHQLNTSMAQMRTEAVPSFHFPSLEVCIDRSKFYEGQSLDEVALVNAARENGFSLLSRSSRTLYVKMLDTTRCYTIIAENEFTPQRKLMSILLQRNPSRDNDDLTTGDAEAKSYHRKKTSRRDRRPSKAESRRRRSSANLDASPDDNNNNDKGGAETCIGSNSPFHTPRFPHSSPLRQEQTAQFDSGRSAFLCREGSSEEVDDDSDDDASGAEEGHCHDNGSSKKYLLLVKGADSSMLDIVNKSNPNNAKLLGPLMENLEDSARAGLRTLVLGQRFVEEQEVKQWVPILEQAMCAMGDRSAKLHAAYALMEKDVDIIGSTSVEDKLQEGVPETLQFFLCASIVVWMLTGDKRETAVTIALTSGLATYETMDCIQHLNASEENPVQVRATEKTNCAASLIEVAREEAEETASQHAEEDPTPELVKFQRVKKQMDAVERKIEEKALIFSEPCVVLVVDGRTLDVVFSDNELSKQFFAIGCRCRSAVCCRMTPIQKAQIVRMFKRHTDLITLAIGDGANDVSMIQESHIGVGIMGLEGSQAELSSDYAIPKFRFLRRLLMVHGRFSLYRDTHCVLYSIYKNMFLTVSMMCYTLFSGYSGQTFIDSWWLAMFSVVFCSVQPMLVGILDKDVDDELAEALPGLYAAISREHMFFSVPYILKWLLDGFVEGIFCFFTLVEMLGHPDNLFRGKCGSLFDYGTVFFTVLVLVTNIRVVLHLTYQNLLIAGVMAVEMIILIVVEFGFTSLKSFGGSNWVVYIAKEVYSSSMFYVYVLASVGISILFTMATSMYIQLFTPWRNAPFAVLAAADSPYVLEFEENRRCLLREYEQRLQYQKECEERCDYEDDEKSGNAETSKKVTSVV